MVRHIGGPSKFDSSSDIKIDTSSSTKERKSKVITVDSQISADCE